MALEGHGKGSRERHLRSASDIRVTLKSFEMDFSESAVSAHLTSTANTATCPKGLFVNQEAKLGLYEESYTRIGSQYRLLSLILAALDFRSKH